MGELGGFLKITRAPAPERDPRERVADYKEIYEVLPDDEAARQGARCMECGVPFCHDGCPLGNLIPDWNDLVYQGRWREAIEQLHATNDFPEWTGLICPAPCEPACVLAINDDPVSIKQIELAIVERAWEEGWIVPRPPESRSGRSVGVVGSGPAGLAAAAHLNRAGPRGRRLRARRGRPAACCASACPTSSSRSGTSTAASGCSRPRACASSTASTSAPTSPPPSCASATTPSCWRSARACTARSTSRAPTCAGVRFAMDYLYARNRWVARGAAEGDDPELTAAGKHVVVIGGGDTAMDCVGNAHREGALSVTVLDTYPAPPGPAARDSVPWPGAPRRLVSTYALDEGGERRWTQTATHLDGRDGHVVAVHGTYVTPPPGPEPVPGTEFELPADLVLIAIGFSHPEHAGAVEQLGLELDRRGQRQGADVRELPSGRVRGRRRADRAVARGQRDRRGTPLRAGRRPPPGRRLGRLTASGGFCAPRADLLRCVRGFRI